MTTSTVRSYSPLALRSSLVFSTNNTTFPASPVNGQTVLVNGVLWCYSTIEGSAAWNPLTNQKNSYVHTQAVASFQWTVVHNLGNENLVYGVYDSDGNLTIANIHFINNSSFTLNFTSATAGRVVVFADAQRHAQSLSATAFTADSVSIASGVVTADNTGVHINGFPVPVLVGGLIPAAQIPTLQWPNINGTPTTVSGYGITDAYTKAQTSALIATNAVGSTTQNFAANTISVAGNILPTGTGQTIGSPVARFSAIYVNEAYLAASTLYIDGTPVMKTTAENVHITADLNQGILIQTTGTGHLTLDSAAGTTIQTSAQNADCVVQATGLGSLARITSATEVKLTAPVVTLLGAVGITGDTTITGNFTVTGTTVTVNSTNVTTKDNIIVLNKGEIGSGVTAGISGFEIDRGDSANVRFLWSESSNSFVAGIKGSETAIPTTTTLALKADISSVYTQTASDARYVLSGAIIDGGTL